MSEVSTNNSNFVGYEYRDITVDREMESMYIDGYQNFGWRLEKSSTLQIGLGNTILKFKRDRKIRNKMELTRLQRQFDFCVSEIVEMEKSKATNASFIAYTVGLIGSAFMAGSVFSIVATPPQVVYCIILALPAFICWLLPYFLYKSTYAKKAAELAPLIDNKYDEIYEVCERANNLLGN